MQEEHSKDVVEQAEDLGRRLGIGGKGEGRLELHFSNGKLRRTDMHAGGLAPDQLRAFAAEIEERA